MLKKRGKRGETRAKRKEASEKSFTCKSDQKKLHHDKAKQNTKGAGLNAPARNYNTSLIFESEKQQ